MALFMSIRLEAQPGTGVLKVNNLEGSVASNGLLFDSAGTAMLRTKAGMVLANRAGIWISARETSGNIIVSTHDVLGTSHEFSPGPLELSGIAPDPSLWNRVYPISKTEIDFHKANYKKDGYTASANILNWPGSSDPPYAKILAPFVDFQVNNQKYEPLSGDYPYIVSDAMIYSISNDRYSNSDPMGIEVHTSLFGFAKDSALENCILARYTVHNRSGKDYSNFRLSSVINFRIGNTENEFLGTDVSHKTLFAVNDTGEATFSNKLVSMGCMLLNGRISSTMYFNNNSDPISGRPVSDQDYYFLMQGRWKSGKQLTYFGNGVDGSIPARYIYPYTSDASHGDTLWSEESTLNLPGSRFGLVNTDSTVLKNGEAKKYDFVYFFVEKNNYNVKQIGDFCSKIKGALASKNLLETRSEDDVRRRVISCFPNPAESGEKLGILNAPETALYIRLLTMDGKEICKLDLDINNNLINLPLYLNSGLYMIEFKTLNMTQYNKLLINNH